MQVQFREFSQFDVWFWLEFNNVPSEQEKKLVEEVFSSWFFLGKLGGFNAENSQVQETGLDLSYMDYDNDANDSTMMSVMHNLGDFEYEGNWGRCWLDLGTSDSIAIDILINSLSQLSKEYVEIHQLLIGGENDDWEIDPSYKESLFQDINQRIGDRVSTDRVIVQTSNLDGVEWLTEAVDTRLVNVQQDWQDQ